MTDKNAWEIKQLQERVKENTKDIRELMAFKGQTTERLRVIFEKLKELQDSNLWIKRMFITALTGGVVSVLGALIVWAFQN